MESNWERFITIYAEALKDAVKNHPDEYGYPLENVPGVVARMAAAIQRGSFNKDGKAFKTTCKFLGIPYTYKGIKDFIAVPFSQN